MSVLLDTSYLMALHNRRDPLRPRALEIAEDLASSVHGESYFTDYIVDELMTLAWRRTKRTDVVQRLHDEVLSRSGVSPGNLLFVGEEEFRAAASLHRRLHSRLSFTDCSILAVARAEKIPKVASFDDGFDGHIERLH